MHLLSQRRLRLTLLLLLWLLLLLLGWCAHVYNPT
jgi:cbb3-type cytochrome oxidase subunit 3